MNVYDGTYSPSRNIMRQTFYDPRNGVPNRTKMNNEVDNVINRNINGLYEKKIEGIKLEIEKLKNQIVMKNDELHKLSAEKNILKLNKSKLKKEYRSVQSKTEDFTKKVNEMEISLFNESNKWKSQFKETVAENEKIANEIMALRGSHIFTDTVESDRNIRELSIETERLTNELTELQKWYDVESSIQFEEKKELSLSNLKINLENDMLGLDERLTQLELKNQEELQSINKFEILSEKEIFTEYNLLLEYQKLKKIKKVYILQENNNDISKHLEYDAIKGTQYKFYKIFSTVYECSIFLRVFLRKNLLNQKILISLVNFKDNFTKILDSTFLYIDSITENLRLNLQQISDSKLEPRCENSTDVIASQDLQTIQLNGTIYQKTINMKCDISSIILDSASPSGKYDDVLIIVNTTDNDTQLNMAFDYSNRWNRF